MDKVELKIDWATYEAAKYACEHWHYSKTIPANKSNYIGVWENKLFKGVIIFGLGASPSLGKPYGLGVFQVCELTRIALKEHFYPVSKMVKIAFIYLRNRNPKLKLVISFADTFHDHHGGIYQAGNWIYTGMSSKSKIWQLPDGTFADLRRFNGHGHNKKSKVPLGSVLINTPGKHRYLMPLDDEMRKQIEPLRKPYPKRPKQAMASDQEEQRRGSADPDAPKNEVKNDAQTSP
jgi:hypothetical protein